MIADATLSFFACKKRLKNWEFELFYLNIPATDAVSHMSQQQFS